MNTENTPEIKLFFFFFENILQSRSVERKKQTYCYKHTHLTKEKEANSLARFHKLCAFIFQHAHLESIYTL